MNEEQTTKYIRKKTIEKLMFDTYAKAKELNCSINVNAKTRRMSWDDHDE